jgi:hypothetical protein
VGVAIELDRVADAEADGDKGGNITPRQIEAAARIAVQTQDVNSDALLQELDKLCREYDAVRRTLPSGIDRTRAMTRVVVKMRTLAPSLVSFIDIYKASRSAGNRLAAVAMMQMEPHVADLDWLKNRFSSEQPFIFYHAALALQNVANILRTPEDSRRLRLVGQQALNTVQGFAGAPDANTVGILEHLISSLAEKQA